MNNLQSLDNENYNNEYLYTLISSDQIEIKDIPLEICHMSEVIKCIINNCPDMKINGEQQKIPISNVNGVTLEKIVDWLKYHHNNPPKKIERPITTNDLSTIVCKWDFNFINIEIDEVINLMNAVNYLDIKELLDLCCAKMASLIKGKSPAEIRQILRIENDLEEKN